MLSDKALQELKQIWLNHHPDESIDDQSLQDMAVDIYSAVELLFDNTENL